MPISIFLLDDHPALRLGLRRVLELHTDLECVGEAGDVQSGFEGILETSPDVALIDISLPGGSGLEVVRRVDREATQTKVLVLTGVQDDSLLRVAFAAGAHGFVVKRTSSESLVSAIRAVHAGRSFVDAESLGVATSEGLERRTCETLSKRETEVVTLVALGFTNKEIGQRLTISPKTVATYRARVQDKLGLKTRSQIVSYARASGLLDDDHSLQA